MMTPPKPKFDLFHESPCLVSKKRRTSTPSLRPPKPPTKSSSHIRRQRGYLEHGQTLPLDLTSTPRTTSAATHHDGSFSYGLSYNNNNNIYQPMLQNVDEYSRMYQQFEVISKIGSGYFADVYKVKSLKDCQYYAIKKTSIPFTSNSDRLRKLKEVINHQTLPSHPNCVRYHDSWEEDGYLYIQTELCKSSLNGIIETSEEHKLPEHIVWSYLLDLLLAVKHLHDHDLIHMDIKPDNIFISFDGVAKLGDFGLMCNCVDLNSSAITNCSSYSPNDHDDSGFDEGDSKYLASETMQGKFTKAADIFSLGITTFEVASGLNLPQRGEIYHKLRHNEIEDLYFNGLSADLVKIIKMMMEQDYLKRPNVDELLRLLAERAI